MSLSSFADEKSGKGLTIDKINGALTNFYIPKMWEMIHTSTPGLEFFKDLGPVVDWSGPGYKGFFKTRQKAKKGVVGGRVGRLPSAGNPTFDEPSVEYTVFRNLIQFEWDSKMRTSMERYDKLKRIIEGAVEDCGDEFRRRLNTYLYCPSNAVAVVNGAHTTTATINLKSVHTSGATAISTGTSSTGHKTNGACQYIEPGDQLLIDNGTKRAFVTVKSVQHSANTVTLETALTANSDNAVQDGALVYFAAADVADNANTDDGLTAVQLEQSDRSAELLGLANCYYGDPGAAANYLGKTLDAGTYWHSVNEHNSGTNRALSLVLIDKMLGLMNDQRHVYPNLMIMNTGMFHEFNDLSEKNHAFFNQGDLPGGHSPQVRKKYFTVKTTMAQGDLDILVDKYAPMEQITVVDSQSCGYANVYKEAEAKEDGSFLRHSDSDYDVWHGWTRWAGQFFSMSPAAVGRLNDITQDIRNL